MVLGQEWDRDLAKNWESRYVWSELMDKNSTEYLMKMLDLNETIDRLTKANSVRWYGHVLRKDKNNHLRRAFDFKVNETRK